MIEIKRVLVPSDFSTFSARALEQAVALARWYEARLTVLHVVPQPLALHGDGVPIAQSLSTREAAAAELSRFVEPASAARVPVETAVSEGEPVREILRRASEGRADLLVMGTHGRGGFERWVLGSVTEKVLRKAPCPVLTVSGHESAQAAATLKGILCPVDFSEASSRALQYAFSLAQETDARLALLHVVRELPAASDPASFDVSGYRARVLEEARQRLRGLVPAGVRDWCTPEELIATGKPHREIVRAAQARAAGLIVMGVHGRGVVDLALFGSTTHQVVRAADCPVLTIRTAAA